MSEIESLRSLVEALYQRLAEECDANESLREQNAMLDKKLARLEGKTRKATRDEKIVNPGVYEVKENNHV
jgi:septation ring formation regulator EzrA